MSGKTEKVIITAALSGAGTFRANTPHVPYTPEEFAEAAHLCYKAGASMVHVHAKQDDGMPTHDLGRIRDTYNAIRDKTPELIVNLSTAVGMGKTPEQRIEQIVEIKPEMASFNTNTMNFALIDRNTGQIMIDYIFENTFTMIQNFAKLFNEAGTKPEFECYDPGGLDNILLMSKQEGLFKAPMNFNFVCGVAGGMAFRPDIFTAMFHAIPPGSNFTTCGVGLEEFPAIMQSCLMGGHMRVGLEDNVKMPNGELAKGNYELVELAVKVGECMGREPATPDEAREVMGLKK